ncbi:bifunctional 2-C-methyl-D-erythritol 4-phosphate cytidylyltransferase/2-C-methyl-D-erythritol 2,4-cyclodiphosphate synthase [Wolbachia pipientis]|uniref:Bifunctional enzyme IspD/IspF n=1 Tax=Wolbachia pipientis TaxID=955 RepID=A0A1E7QL55_WOLPI|nr:2-C-methyl-D-erythritol 2,4-cyclodiphosphate synthase [Wolbachia pipientis]OEY87205.1 bifunctional 2-C-methyl-D-erythritol 4-phosphate cytidylyltransferase/2-C-methyl-D-erythritol 2,4-cyclodiphosphate synthase [Wolbachia pipientis]
MAAGIGKRCDTNVPKQYIKLAGKPILFHTIKKFTASKYIDYIRVVINKDHKEHYDKVIISSTKLLDPVYGGKTRQESVKLGLESLQQISVQYVIIHDVCRPFVSLGLIERLIKCMRDSCDGIVPVVNIEDTVSLISDHSIESTICRTKLRAVQTPQIFNFQELLLHHQFTKELFTDDSSLMIAHKKCIIIVPGEKSNIKLTTQEDIDMVTKFRIGTGYDIHRFVKTTDKCFITICGVEIEHDMAIDAHSDGDVAIHAIVDAILGALGCGDIGEHFPPSSSTWEGCDSSHFLDFAVKKAHERGYDVSNLDVTLICERPKISPYKVAMKKSIAKILGISDEYVNIKATTAERLGSIGREEGILAHATVLLCNTMSS